MQGIGIGCCSNDVVGQLELSPTMSNSSSSLSMELDESPESRIQRLISEHPVIIFTRSSCCMCHVMKKLLATIGVNPTVIGHMHRRPRIPRRPPRQRPPHPQTRPSRRSLGMNYAYQYIPPLD
ncbi:Glutaredoxin-C6 [Glycine soja]|nr:Glutaredoxin-C6 [Glycine soja]